MANIYMSKYMCYYWYWIKKLSDWLCLNSVQKSINEVFYGHIDNN